MATAPDSKITKYMTADSNMDNDIDSNMDINMDNDNDTTTMNMCTQLSNMFIGCQTLADTIAVFRQITNLDMLDTRILQHASIPAGLRESVPSDSPYCQEVQNNVYRTISSLFERVNNPSTDQLELYKARARAAIYVLREHYGWDFRAEKYRAELLGYSAIYRIVPNIYHMEMLHLYLAECNGRTWINRPIRTPSGNHQATTLLCFLAKDNEWLDSKVPRAMFEIVLEYGADPNVIYECKYGYSPLAFACMRPDGWLARKLLEHGASVAYNGISFAIHLVKHGLLICNQIRDGARREHIGERIKIRDLAEYQQCALALLDHGVNVLMSDVLHIHSELIDGLYHYNKQKYTNPQQYIQAQLEDIYLSSPEYRYSWQQPIHKYGELLMCNDDVVYNAILRKLRSGQLMSQQLEIKKKYNTAGNVYDHLYWLMVTETIMSAQINDVLTSYASNKYVSPRTYAFRRRIRSLIYEQILEIVIASSK